MNAKKILVVDDNRVTLQALSMKLRSHGYVVLVSDNGPGALSTARREEPDLILLDLNFPGEAAAEAGVQWDGFLMMDWLRRTAETIVIPTIVLTANDPAKYKERSLAAGAVNFFHKSIHPDKLVEVIRGILEEKSVGEPPAG